MHAPIPTDESTPLSPHCIAIDSRVGMRRVIVLSGVLLTVCTGSISASASDGISEINQTCAVQTGCFAGDTAGFPITIDGAAGRSYRLTGDLVVPDENTDGIQVSADNITIDLAGFEVRGPVVCSGEPLACTPNAGTGSGIEGIPLVTGISVRNGSIRGMGLNGVTLSFQAEVTHVRFRSNRRDGINVSRGSNVSSNTAYQNGSRGIFVEAGSTVSGNSVHQNGGHGIQTSAGSTVAGNTAFLNGVDGINAGGVGSTVSGNTAYLNGQDGISADAGSMLLGNTVRSNTGFGLNLQSGCGYRENVITLNTAGAVNGVSIVNLGSNGCGAVACP